MSDFGWFKLLIRALGVLFLGLAAPQLLRILASVFIELVGARPGLPRGGWDPLLVNLPSLVGYGVQTAIGYYLLVRGALLIEHCLRGVRGRCAACGYNLKGITGPECPECGTAIRRPMAPHPPSAA